MTFGLYRSYAAHIKPHNDCENGTIGTAVVGVCVGTMCNIIPILLSRYSVVGRDFEKDVGFQRSACYIMSGDALHV